jgi:hypothetical protein
LEAPLMYSWAGNLHNGQIEQFYQGSQDHFDPLCYSFDFRYYSRIKHAVIKYQSMSSAHSSSVCKFAYL